MTEKIGYHIAEIEKGVLGEPSKIIEEFIEFEDALQQDSKIMAIMELSDLYGAIESYISKHYNLKMEDLAKMNEITKRAFQNGRRK